MALMFAMINFYFCCSVSKNLSGAVLQKLPALCAVFFEARKLSSEVKLTHPGDTFKH